MKRIVLLAAFTLTVMAPSTSLAQATLASLKGTYTYQQGMLDAFSVEVNAAGDQIGFCAPTGPLIGYYCWSPNYTFDVMVGSLVSDGAGNITSGTYVITRDPNDYKCSSSHHPVGTCPVVVPSKHVYSTSTTYAIGSTVDYTVGTVTRTYQAVRSNLNKPPNWTLSADIPYICTTSNASTCLWTQASASQTNPDNANNTGSLVGTYTIQSTGVGVMTLSPSTCGGCGTIVLQFIVPPTSVVGQPVSLLGLSQLNSQFSVVGSGVRIK